VSQPHILLTGASGYVGRRLLDELRARDLPVRCLARDPATAQLPPEIELVVGDVYRDVGLAQALDGADVAYYLVHSMGRRSGPTREFAQRDRVAARNFAQAAARAGVRRVIYLGGLPTTGEDSSDHLRSRHEVAEALGAAAPEFAYARAAMVIGAGSASFEMLRHLVQRLPAMLCPRWIDTRSQPIAIADVTRALGELATRASVPGEVQLGGADVLTYREMMARFASITGRRPPLMVRVPVLTPRLSSYWVQLVTPVDGGLVRPLVDGLRSEMIVTAPPAAGLNDAPLGFDAAVRAALAEAA